MPDQLDDVEARILGSLVEKSLTTPELYPLTLNALVNACNQKTSREPVMSLGHSEVDKGLGRLLEKGYAGRRYDPGGRAAKYSHRIEVLLCSEDPKIIATICILLLRGPQTAGEIKARTERLCQFSNAAEVDGLLQELSNRVDGPIVSRLPRQPGQKEARFAQLFAAASVATPGAGTAAVLEVPAPAQAAPDRMAKLEKRVEELEAQVAEFRSRLGP